MNYILIIQTFISLFQTITTLMPQGSTTQEKCDATLVGLTGVVGDVSTIAPALQAMATTVEAAIAAAGSGGAINYTSLIGTTMNLIKDIEELMPASAGKDKFEAVVSGLTALVGDVTALVPALSALATTAVNGLRAVGLFKTPVATAQTASAGIVQ